MLSINTNLSGLIAQNSLTTSTDKLNQAIERMTTGLKINHASDNAANYSISTNLTTQLSAYDIAADNVANGMDLVNYANDIISQMQDKAARLNALSTQARNGTYGGKSLDALNSEASAIMAEITRLYNTAEYNDISLFNRKEYTIAPHLPQAGESGFIDETALVSPAGAGPTTEAPTAKAEYNGFIADPVSKPQSEVDALTSVTGANGTLNESEYKVASVEDLVELARLVNEEGVDTTGKTFYLAKDLDLGTYCEANISTGGWTPIGTSTNRFYGTFDGNGHVIKNLKIDRETSNYQGLFGEAQNGELKNIGIVNVEIKGHNEVGGLVGVTNSTITNSYATGSVTGQGDSVGGLAGEASTITNSYVTGSVTGQGDYVGGLVGSADSSITNSYATGAVTGQANYVGGLVGYAYTNSTITNSYATGDVINTGEFSRPGVGVGGLAGSAHLIINSYATGNVVSTNFSNYDYGIGGLVGSASGDIINSYSTGNVNGNNYIGGLVGSSESLIINSYSLGDVSGVDYVGGLIGYCSEGDNTIRNSYCTGDVKGNDYVGGLVGYWNSVVYRPTTAIIENSVSYSKVNGNTNVATLANINSSGQLSISLNNVKLIEQDGVEAVTTTTAYDLSAVLAAISNVAIINTSTTLQVGIYGKDSCQLNFDTNFNFNEEILSGGIESVEAFDAIVEFEKLLSDKATMLGAVQNRLDSALESIEVNINNLTSSRSTIRDADIAEVSSEYIKQQILQQASATLMATANQAPAIALQLI